MSEIDRLEALLNSESMEPVNINADGSISSHPVGRAPDGDIVFANPAKVAHDAEEFECAWMYLDKIGVPTVSDEGGQYSLVGRIMAAIRRGTL